MLVAADVQCPYCGETFPLWLDTSQGDHSTVEDCTVCCRPLLLQVQCEPGDIVDVIVDRG